MKISRRDWLKGFGAIAGAAIGTRLPGTSWLAKADPAAAPKSAVISIFLQGGFNAIFSAADSFGGGFGVTSTNVTNVGNGLVVDKSTIGSLGSWALGHMAAIGNGHGHTDHPSAQAANFLNGVQSFPVTLAAAMGGDAAFKAVALGSLPYSGPSSSVNGVSMQLVGTMDGVANALGLGTPDPKAPVRSAGGAALARARQMSSPALAANPTSLSFLKDAYDTNVASLSKPPMQIDLAGIASAYGVATSGELGDVKSKLAAAELMLRAGSNVISITDPNWDTHGDATGQTVRNKMSSTIIPSLKTLLTRLQSDPQLKAMNVSIMLHGDFARNLPGSDHAPGLSALVIGNNVKVGTTGQLGAGQALKQNIGASKEMWSYLAALAKTSTNPFGDNPHPLVL